MAAKAELTPYETIRKDALSGESSLLLRIRIKDKNIVIIRKL